MRILIALSISVVLHLLFFGYLNYTKKYTPQKIEPNTSKTKLHYVKLQKPKTEPKINQQKKEPKDITPKVLPKIIEIPQLPKESKLFELPPKIEQTKPKIYEDTKPKQSLLEEKKIEQNKEIKKPKEVTDNLDKVTKSYLELYKDDFDTFSPETKLFLIKNLKDIGTITQRFLIYPHLSIQARQSGINVVEFTLYPNGKISNPKILKSSKYYILDDNSIETIQTAYRDYPRPDKPTIIRIYVKYELI